VLAADLWSLNHAGTGDSDSANLTSSLTSVGVSSQVRTWTPDNADSLVYDDKRRALHNVARPRRPNNTAPHCQPGAGDQNNDDDACYRTLADSVTAGAYQIRLDDTATVLSC